MIQRIQTVYLLICLILVSLMFGIPVSEHYSLDGDFYSFEITGLENDKGEQIYGTLPLAILFGVIDFLIFISIFLYKRRVLQMRICIYNILLLIGSLGLIYYYFQDIIEKYNAPNYSFSFTIVIPLVTIILLYLAFRGIRRDELLVKSVNRIR